jgi:hypothetical protein
MKALSRTKKMVAGGALVLAGFGAGAAVAVTGSASAATDAVSSGVSQAAKQLDPTKSVRPDEHLLTGTTAAKVKAAALAKYPDATIQRVETDSDGVYEAHMVRADGTHITVQVGADFQVTNVIEGDAGKGGHAPAGGAPRGERPPASGSTASS